MKKIAVLFILLVVFSCKKDETMEPKAWLESLIALGGDDNGKFASVYTYTFEGKTVYLFNYTERCCDFFTAQLFDENGKSICYPYGGITGKGNMQCPDFDANKKDEKLYWKGK